MDTFFLWFWKFCWMFECNNSLSYFLFAYVILHYIVVLHGQRWLLLNLNDSTWNLLNMWMLVWNVVNCWDFLWKCSLNWSMNGWSVGILCHYYNFFPGMSYKRSITSSHESDNTPSPQNSDESVTAPSGCTPRSEWVWNAEGRAHRLPRVSI